MRPLAFVPSMSSEATTEEICRPKLNLFTRNMRFVAVFVSTEPSTPAPLSFLCFQSSVLSSSVTCLTLPHQHECVYPQGHVSSAYQYQFLVGIKGILFFPFPPFFPSSQCSPITVLIHIVSPSVTTILSAKLV